MQTIISGIASNIKNNGTIGASNIVDSIQIVKAKNFLSFFTIAVSITLCFSYIIARLTLFPARNALKSQKRFVSDIAHELRTPLAIIKTNAEVALLDELYSSQAKKIFKSTIEELDRASAIINNLLTFNNLVHPEQIKFGPVNMASVLDTALDKLDELIKKKEIKLVVKKIAPFTVWGNITALEQIMINIIKNAVNYTQEGGSVTAHVEPDYQGNIIFTVQDNGIGISQDDLLHIFEPFYRSERSRNRNSGSSGLGLTIVSELVKLHFGRISVQSRLKQGTLVTVILPFSKNNKSSLLQDENMENEVSIDFLKKR